MSNSQKPKQDLYSKLRVCGVVKETIDTKGWQEILGPKLEKMIKSVCGFKTDKNEYIPGYIDRCKDEELLYYKGYKSALMDVWNEAYNHIIAIDKINAEIKALTDKDTSKEKLTKPMEDTQYAPEK